MMRPRTLLLIVAALAVVAIAAWWLYPMCATELDEHAEVEAIICADEVCEVVVELGEVAPSSLTTCVLSLTNDTEYPLAIVDYTTLCRCMWLDFEREAIAPGESIAVELTFDSRGEWGTVGNYMELITSDKSCQVVVWISAEVAQ